MMDAQTQVYCYGCQESHSTQDVKFLNIEENAEGHDVMTFFCEKSQHEGISSVRKPSYKRLSSWF